MLPRGQVRRFSGSKDVVHIDEDDARGSHTTARTNKHQAARISAAAELGGTSRMQRDLVAAGLAASLLAAMAAGAAAHVTLEKREAQPGSGYKAVFSVPHGCEGAPTVEVRVDIPEGVIAVKPMPKPGWTLALEKGPYARTYDFYHGEKKSEGVRRVTWSGGSLPDEYFDQFVLSTFIAGELDGEGVLVFPVTQKCADGKELAWSEIAADGADPHSLAHPAPLLQLVAGDDGMHEHHANHAAAHGPIEIDGPWARPAQAGGTGAGYLKITNNGTDTDELVGASSDAAERVELHETSIDDKGVASMHKLELVELKSGQSIELKPAGMHLMLIGLKAPLQSGGAIKVKLDFKRAGPVEIEFPVKPSADADGGGHEHHHH